MIKSVLLLLYKLSCCCDNVVLPGSQTTWNGSHASWGWTSFARRTHVRSPCTCSGRSATSRQILCNHKVEIITVDAIAFERAKKIIEAMLELCLRAIRFHHISLFDTSSHRRAVDMHFFSVRLNNRARRCQLYARVRTSRPANWRKLNSN